MKITGQTKIFGIFGYPIKHTLSPSMHNAAFKSSNLNCVYIPFEVAPKDLKNAVLSLKWLKISGINVTVPHKERIIEYLDKMDPLAKKIGSVNTVKNVNGKLIGYNTDGKGFLKDLISCGFNPKRKTALIIGAGGAGKAVASALSLAGAKKIYLSDKRETLAKTLAKKTKKAVYVPFKIWKTRIQNADILINATPIGMHRKDPGIIDTKFLKKDLFVYDLVYNRETKLLKDSKRLKLKAFSGLGMLLSQGAISFEIWTGQKAPVNVMKKTLLNSLKRSD